MKKLLIFFPVFFISLNLLSQAPQGISYQAVIRDSDKELVSESTVGIRVAIISESPEGTEVYAEEHSVQTNMNGLVSLVIGQGNVVSGNFEEIDWSQGQYFISTATDISGGTNYEILSTTQLLSVPYALFAEKAATSEDAFSGDYEDLENAPDLSLFATKDMQNENITNLADPQDEQDAVTKSYVDNLIDQLRDRVQALEDTLGIGPPPVEDIDGNVYETVRIGNQLWMAENLRVTHYKSGEPIPNLADKEAWADSNSDGFAWYDNDFETWGEDYGALYNWHAVIHEDGLCPEGWTPAKEADWVELINFIDPDSDPTNWPESAIAGGELKSTRTEPDDDHPRWESPNLGATDEYGFSALPGGWRASGGLFHAIGVTGYWWSATQGGTGAWYRSMVHENPALWRSGANFSAGMSVRCIKPAN